MPASVDIELTSRNWGKGPIHKYDAPPQTRLNKLLHLTLTCLSVGMSVQLSSVLPHPGGRSWQAKHGSRLCKQPSKPEISIYPNLISTFHQLMDNRCERINTLSSNTWLSVVSATPLHTQSHQEAQARIYDLCIFNKVNAGTLTSCI